MCEGQPLTFIAQLDLADVNLSKRWKMPKSGTLYVFLGRTDERAAVEHRVLYVPRPRGRGQLARRSVPTDVEMRNEDAPLLKPCTFKTQPVISLPGRHCLAFESLGIPDENEEQLWELKAKVSEPTKNYQRGARLFGYPDDVDEDPRYIVALSELGKSQFDHTWKRKNRKRLDQQASQWTLLFEMGSSHALGLCIWDYYTLQVLIRWDDLAARRFDRTHALASRT